jgi:spore coat protein U-like protein
MVFGMIFGFSTNAYSVDFDTGEILVSANVIATCELITQAINFGDYGGVPISETGTLLAVNCLSPVPYKVALDAGLNPVDDRRHMTGAGGHTLKYEIYKQDGSVWGGPGYRGSSWTGNIGTGDWQRFEARWELRRAQFGRNLGVYNDTVGVTVYY